MKFMRSPKFLIFLIVFINFLGYGIVFPLLPILTLEYGGSPLISGFLIAIFSLMQVIFMPILGRLSDRYGRKPLLLFSLWGTLASFLLMGATHTIFWLLIARVIDGASGGNLSIAQAYIADVTDKKKRAGGMGIIAAGISLGFIIGPLWGGVLSKINFAAPFIGAAFLTFGSIILTHFFLIETITSSEKEYEKKHFDLGHFLKNAFKSNLFRLYLVNLLIFWAQSGIFTTMSLFGKDVLKLSLVGISFVFAFGGFLSAIIQGFAIGHVLKIISEEKLYILSTIISVIGFAILSFGNTILIFFIGITIFMIGNSLLAPVVQGLASELSSEHEQGGNMGILQSFGSVGRIFGPIIAGLIYEKISPFSPSMMGAIAMILILFLGFNIFAKKSVANQV